MLLEKLKNIIGITKNNSIHKSLNKTAIDDEVKFLMSKEFNVENDELVKDWLNHMHKVDYTCLFPKNFGFKYQEATGTVAGAFVKNEKLQVIKINKLWNSKAPAQVKKAIILTAYLHEHTHEVQYDKYLLYKKGKNPKCSAIQKIMNFEIVAQQLPQYDYRMVEIDARMNCMHRLCDLIKNGTIPYNNLFMIEPVTSMLKNVSALSNLTGKFPYFTNQFKFKASHTETFNIEKIDDIKFDINTYMLFYKNFLDFKDDSDLKLEEYNEAQELFHKSEFIEQLREELTEKFEIYKSDMKFLYDFISKNYEPNEQIRKYLPPEINSQEKIDELKKNRQIYFINVIRTEYFSKYIDNYEKEN